MIYFDSFENENTFRTDHNKPQISWEKKLGFVDSEFVKTCDELVIGRSARFSSRESSVIKSEEKPMEISRDARGILESSYQDTDFF